MRCGGVDYKSTPKYYLAWLGLWQFVPTFLSAQQPEGIQDIQYYNIGPRSSQLSTSRSYGGEDTVLGMMVCLSVRVPRNISAVPELFLQHPYVVLMLTTSQNMRAPHQGHSLMVR